jgi:hypothetical protein
VESTGTVFRKTASQFWAACVREGRDEKVPGNKIAPRDWRACEAGEDGSRTKAWIFRSEIEDERRA